MSTTKAIRLLVCLAVAAAAGVAGAAAQSQVTGKKDVTGVRNFTQLDSTIACAGAVTSTAVPEIKKMGFASIVNLRQPNEEGADVEAGKAAAAAAGIKYFHIPFSVPAEGQPAPEPTINEFLRVTADPANQPVLVHCAAANRAAGLWLIKRVVNDKWTVEKAKAEADLAAAPPARAVDWAVGYLKTRQQ